MPAARAAITTASPLKWVSGDLFNGNLLLIMALPTLSGAQYQTVALRDSRPKVLTPQRFRVPIREGVLDPNTKVWQTTGLVPTNVVYSSWFYDDTNRLIGTGPALFTITTDPFTITPPTLTDPTVATQSPVPGSPPNTGVTIVTYSPPNQQDIAGVKNGVNTAFTFTPAASMTVVQVVWNGLVLEQGVQYTRSGTNITMLGSNLPNAGDTFQVVIW